MAEHKLSCIWLHITAETGCLLPVLRTAPHRVRVHPSKGVAALSGVPKMWGRAACSRKAVSTPLYPEGGGPELCPAALGKGGILSSYVLFGFVHAMLKGLLISCAGSLV